MQSINIHYIIIYFIRSLVNKFCIIIITLKTPTALKCQEMISTFRLNYNDKMVFNKLYILVKCQAS